ncbi:MULTISPECIES: extensin family protein [unclassified Polaromonas]|uniref:extensin-like domain-containing protein n=1 Tax=unclassified Polaromonas TaxID=2638319 RepID=UPI000F09522B|nr:MULTISPECIES: extensin family protein [unclassified Polaromonas]AYQ29397.1 extensin [Polaromonas sp. SP1]QGJ19486.1 extensin [Polaromonas sp. Pch-P]
MPAPDPSTDTSSSPPARRFRWGRWLALLIWGALGAGAWGIYNGVLEIPGHLNPWAPLDVTAQPNLLTGYKLSRARSDPARCLAALASTGMQYDTLPDRVTGDGCGFSNAVRLRTAAVRIGAPLSLSCPMALSFYMWERHALQPAAQLHMGQPVAGIDHLGSYACRNINGGEGAPPNAPARSRSRHATANALDIAAFTLASGKRITVLRDWPKEEAATPPSAEALLLRDAHSGACKYFKGVLGPDYNAVHSDHFHLETGGFSMCR